MRFVGGIIESPPGASHLSTRSSVDPSPNTGATRTGFEIFVRSSAGSPLASLDAFLDRPLDHKKTHAAKILKIMIF